MSAHSQRGKVKPIRSRGQRLPLPASGYYKPAQSTWVQDEEWKICHNWELMYMLCRHFLGNLGEVTLSDGDKLVGVVSAISPTCEFGLTYAYGPDTEASGYIDWTDKVIGNFKMIRVTDVKLSDCLKSEVKIDGDAIDPEVIGNCSERELIPYFNASDNLKDFTLDQGGFSAEEMFKTNKELFSIPTKYNPDLREYTIPVDKTAPNFSETEARCAKIAEDIERYQPKSSSEDEDDEQKYSAVARSKGKDCIKAMKTRYNVPGKVAVAVSRSETVSVEKPCDSAVDVNGGNADSHQGKFDDPAVVKDAKHDTKKSSDTVEEPDSNLINGKTEAVNAKSSDTVGKVKKSTLDPNAPEFHPMSVQFSNPPTASTTVAPVSSTPIMSNASPYITLVNTNLPGVVASPSFVPLQQAGVLPSSVPYAIQGNQIPHLLQNSVTSPPPSNIQQTRGSSLPPVQQPAFTTLNPGANLLLQHPQMLNQPLIVTTGHNRFPNSQSVNLNRQRTNDSLTSIPNSGGYGYPQTAVPVPAFQSPAIYQLPQACNPFSFVLSGHPQLGLHLVPTGVPTPVTSSGLVVSSLPMTQASGQQNYPSQSVIQMQPHLQLTNASHEHAQQQNHQQAQTQVQLFPHSINEHAPLTLPPCAPNPLFAQQQARSYYPPIPPVVDGHAPINPAMMAGLLPVMNQCNIPHSVAGPHQPQVDSTMVGSQSQQFQQANCQPPPVMQCFPAPNVSYANVQAAHHINALHAAFAAYAGGGNSSNQTH